MTSREHPGPPRPDEPRPGEPEAVGEEAPPHAPPAGDAAPPASPPMDGWSDRPLKRPARPSMPALDAVQREHDAYRARSRLSWLVAALTVVVATLALHHPIVSSVFGGEPRYFEGVAAEEYWPDLVYFCGELSRSEVPYWNPFDRGGYPYFADPQTAAFHPWTWATCALAGASPTLSWVTLRVVLGFLLCGLFGLLWLRRVGASWSGAIAGAVLLEAAPAMRSDWELNLTFGLAFLPLMLWAAEGVAKRRRHGDALWLALATAGCGWAGSPPALFYAASLTSLYLAFRAGEEVREGGWRTLRALVPPLVTSVGLAVGLLGVVVIPATELTEHSVGLARGLEEIRRGALADQDLSALLWPREADHLYFGLLAIALMPAALARTQDRLGWFFVGVAAIATTMTAGGWLFERAFEWVPFVDRLPGPQRYEAWLGPAGAAFLALGATEIARWPRRDVRAFQIGGAALSAGGAALLALQDAVGPGMLGLGVGALMIAFTLRRPLDAGSAWVGVVLAAIVLFDLSQSLPADRHTRVGDGPCDDGASILARLDASPSEAAPARYFDEFAIGCRSGTRLRRRDLRGHRDPRRLRSYARLVSDLSAHPALLRQFNVSHVLAGPHFADGWEGAYLRQPDHLAADLGVERPPDDLRGRTVLTIEDRMPFAYFVPWREIERATDREAASDRTVTLAPAAIAVLDDASSPPGAGFVEGPDGATGGGEEPRGEEPRGGWPRRRALANARDVHLSPDLIGLTIDAPEDGIVVVNEAYYPGWRATVDGDEAPVYRANGFVRAVFVGVGTRRVEMRFRPEAGVYWRQVFLLSWLVLLFGGAVGLGRRARRFTLERRRR